MFGKNGLFAEIDTVHQNVEFIEHALNPNNTYIQNEETIPHEFGLAYTFIL